MKKIALSAVACLAFLFSCRLESDEFMEPVDSVVKITMLEDLQFGYPSFVLSFRTVANYPCSNYYILMESSVDGNNVNIVLNEVYNDGTCSNEPSPAQNAYTFGDVVDGEYEFENGTYNISLKLKGEEPSTGTLVVTDTDYTLTMTSNPNFNFENSRVIRMPEVIVWGSVRKYSENTQTNELFDDFFELLEEEGLADTTLAEGDYTYFLVDDEGDISLRSSSSIPAGTTAFVQYFDEDSVSRNSLRTSIGDFRAVYSQYLKIDAFDWEGTVY